VAGVRRSIYPTGEKNMAGPIYKFYRVRLTEAFYQLSPAERQALLEKIEEIGKQGGVKPLVFCNSSWSNEQWDAFGVEEFPDLAAIQAHKAALDAVDWFRYIQAETMLGTAWAPA
jgi:hypothetical protein